MFHVPCIVYFMCITLSDEITIIVLRNTFVICTSFLAPISMHYSLHDHLYVVRRLFPQSPGGTDCLCVFFLSFGLFMLLYVFPGPTQYVGYFIRL